MGRLIGGLIIFSIGMVVGSNSAKADREREEAELRELNERADRIEEELRRRSRKWWKPWS